jgi:MSHA biogenesis protein MshG
MPDYTYKGRDNSGALVTGTRRAASEDALADLLQSENILPVEINEAKVEIKNTISFSVFRKKVKSEELQLFCRQMHTLLKAGIPIVLAITRLAQTTKDKHFVEILTSTVSKLNEGQTLESALKQFPDAFSRLFINVVNVGENTGQLDIAFLHLGDYLQLEVETRQKIKTALRYPIMVVSAVVIAILIVNFMVIPTFAKVFEKIKTELPLPTKILMASSHLITNYWYVLLGLLVLFIIAFRLYIKNEEGLINWHWFLLKIPIIGWIVHRTYLSRFARLYSLIMRSGITALDGMKMVGEATGNAYIASKISDITGYIARGNTIASACVRTELFSPLVIQMITLGEETGNLDNMLDDVADFYDRELAYDLERLSDLMEPVLLIIMAIMVLILALGVFLPMWDMVAQSGKR